MADVVGISARMYTRLSTEWWNLLCPFLCCLCLAAKRCNPRRIRRWRINKASKNFERGTDCAYLEVGQGTSELC